MKRSKLTEAEIAIAIKESDTSTGFEEVCQNRGYSEEHGSIPKVVCELNNNSDFCKKVHRF